MIKQNDKFIKFTKTFQNENYLATVKDIIDSKTNKEGKEALFTILEENPFNIAAVKLKGININGFVYKGRYIKN